MKRKIRPTSSLVWLLNLPFATPADFIDFPQFSHYGLLQTASVLRNRGFRVRILDAFSIGGMGSLKSENGTIPWGCNATEFLGAQSSLAESPDAMVFLHHPYWAVGASHERFSDLVKHFGGRCPPSRRIVADCATTGFHFLEMNEATARGLSETAASYIPYEAEVTVPDSIARILEGRAVESVMPGVPPGPTLDVLPPVDWDMLDVHRYFNFQHRMSFRLRRGNQLGPIGRTLPFMASRGCPYRCSFCRANPGGGKHRRHSLPFIEAVLTDWVDRWSVEKIIFLDPVANLEEDEFAALLDLLARLNLRYDFANGLRADRLSMEHLLLMKDRITLLQVSIESGNERVREELVGKKLDTVAIERVAQWAHQNRIPCRIHYLVGLPGERLHEGLDTFELAGRMFREFSAEPAVQFAVPLRGTRLHGAWSDAGVEPPPPHPVLYSEASAWDRCNVPFDRRLFEAHRLFQKRLRLEGTRKLILNSTYACNNKCIFCAVGDKPRVHADLKRLAQILEEGAARSVRWLDLDGGEPGLFPHLLPLITLARTLGYEQIHVTSNGRMLAYETVAERWLKSGLTSLLISIHGPTAAVHELHTKSPGSFEQTVRGIRNVLKLKQNGTTFGINVTLTRHNIHSLETMMGWAESEGIETVNLQGLTPFGRAVADLVPSDGELTANLDSALGRWSGKLTVRVVNIPFCLVPGHEAHAEADLGKFEREMVFADEGQVRLHDWLSQRRIRTAQCAECAYAVLCDGRYMFAGPAGAQASV